MARRSAANRLFLRRLREPRFTVGMTQADVAEKLRRPQDFIPKCESGDHRVDVVELQEFARFYKKDLNRIVRSEPTSYSCQPGFTSSGLLPHILGGRLLAY